MNQPQTITIDDIKYVRADSISTNQPMTNKRIIVADRGWIFVGDCEDHADGSDYWRGVCDGLDSAKESINAAGYTWEETP